MAQPDYLTEFQRGLQSSQSLVDMSRKSAYTKDLSSLYSQPMTTPERMNKAIPIMAMYDPASAMSAEQSLFKIQHEAQQDKMKQILEVAMPVIKAGLESGDTEFVSAYTNKMVTQFPELKGIMPDLAGSSLKTPKGDAKIAFNKNTNEWEWTIIKPSGEVQFTGARAENPDLVKTPKDKTYAGDMNTHADYVRLWNDANKILDDTTRARVKKTLTDQAIKKGIGAKRKDSSHAFPESPAAAPSDQGGKMVRIKRGNQTGSILESDIKPGDVRI